MYSSRDELSLLSLYSRTDRYRFANILKVESSIVVVDEVMMDVILIFLSFALQYKNELDIDNIKINDIIFLVVIILFHLNIFNMNSLN